ncbi:NupC/NupG family nucleoside CNT transporter [Paucilactobacillus nenjiangensis]|uniref:NupC/NupG family nucleoside CNT transporter n=1 Tax=Paucilactobacillus nenjiangensis TaxID=1296540 RepID=UPI0028D8579A|nr:nucleoside transporter C-terminal domain-containing protein [Paucilactobacillus nenjiangensis]
MYIAINALGLVVFLLVGFLFSKNKKGIHWKSIGIMVVINLVLAWFFTSFSAGRAAIQAAADGFSELVKVAYVGITFALPNWVTPLAQGGAAGGSAQSMNFVTSALLPILMIVPMFDILTYFGILPWIIKWIGRGLSFITGQPKFESFFAVEMMFLGNTEVLAISGMQLRKMSAQRNLTIAMMSMSCVTASIIGAYVQMVPGQYVLTAVPINIINSIIVTSMINPVDVAPEDDTIATVSEESEDGKREPFFSFLGDSILNAGKLILIIFANVVAFVALAALIDKIFVWIHLPQISLENVLGIIMSPFAFLMGMPWHDAWILAQHMGMKLVTNEFVVMGEVTGKTIASYTPHLRAVLTVFLTSFANLSTTGMIIGAFKGIVGKETNTLISKNVGLMLVSGILVSLLSAGFVGLFVW